MKLTNIHIQISTANYYVYCSTPDNGNLPDAFAAYFWAHADQVISPEMPVLLAERLTFRSAILILTTLFSFERKSYTVKQLTISQLLSPLGQRQPPAFIFITRACLSAHAQCSMRLMRL